MQRPDRSEGTETETEAATSGAEVGKVLYRAMREGLCDLVSPQAADAVLSRALAGDPPSTLDLRSASRLLRGTVRRELERSLPKSAVRRRLQALDRSLATLPLPGPPLPEPASAHDAGPAATGAEPAVTEAVAPATPVQDLPAVPAEEATAPPAAAAPRAPVTPSEPPLRAIRALAERDAVRQWAWIPEDGPALAQGSGPAVDDVARDLAGCYAILSRFGPVRGMHVRYGGGHVVVQRLRDASLVLAADSDLNVGAVRSALRDLEEAP